MSTETPPRKTHGFAALERGFARIAESEGALAPLVLLGLGCALLLPLLGSYGLWDPTEVRVAEPAKEMAHTASWQVPLRVVGPRAPLLYWAMSAGYRLLGSGEIGGRLPIALLSILAVLAAYYTGAGLLRRRGAFLGAFALLTSPVFFLGARQLNSHVAPILATTLAVGGLGRAAWPRAGAEGRAALDLAVGIVGLLLGFFAGGIVLGVFVPLAAVGLGLVLTQAGTQGSQSGVARALALIIPIAAVAVLAAAVSAFMRGLPGGAHVGYSPLLIGTPRVGAHQVELITLLRQVGFGSFPWIALAPLAVARAFSVIGQSTSVAGDAGSAVSAGRSTREDYGRLVLVAWLTTAYFTQTLFMAEVSEQTHFGGYAAVALLAGSFLDDIWDARERPVAAGVLALLGTAIIAHDFLMAPEHWAGAHILDGIKWPTPAGPDKVLFGLHLPTSLGLAPEFILFIGLAFGALLALGSAVDSESNDEAPAAAGTSAFGGRRTMFVSALMCALVGALGAIYWVVPAVSQHLSFKDMFNKYKALVGTGDSEIGKYHVPGQLAEYGKTSDLASLPQVFDFLAKSQRVFVIASADDLPAIDQYAKGRASQGTAPSYFVVDDSNSKFLMISNQLGAEKDKNPLRRYVLSAEQPLPKPPEHEVHIDFEGKVEIVGYDLPAELDRGHDFTIRIYYKVKTAIPSPYKVFLHFDGVGTRFNGDHVPLEGRFPTNYWAPGFYVIDEHKMSAERASAPAGQYFIYTGFWLGEQRLKVTSGPQDGEQRAKLGSVRVK